MLSTIKEVEGRISAYYSRYKFFLIRNHKSSGGVEILLAEDVLEVKCIPDRICLIKTNAERCLDDGFTNVTFNELLCTMATTCKSEKVFHCGDFNAHDEKQCKAGNVEDMLRASSEVSTSLLCRLANDIIADKKIL